AYEAAAAMAADEAAVAVLEQKLGRVHDRRGDPALAERHLAEALRLGGESARVQADRSLAAHRRGADAEALELAERALALGAAAAPSRATAIARRPCTATWPTSSTAAATRRRRWRTSSRRWRSSPRSAARAGRCSPRSGSASSGERRLTDPPPREYHHWRVE